MRVTFSIPGRIGGKGRVRHHGKKHWNDAKTEAGESIVRHYAAEAMKGKALLTGPLSISVEMWLRIPMSWSKRKREAAEWVTGRPDCDNVLKLLADAMNRIVYADDSQIADVSFCRRYTKDGAEEVAVYVCALEEEAARFKQQRAA